MTPVSIADRVTRRQLSALASEPARVARNAEFHQRGSRGAKSNQAEEMSVFQSLRVIKV